MFFTIFSKQDSTGAILLIHADPSSRKASLSRVYKDQRLKTHDRIIYREAIIRAAEKYVTFPPPWLFRSLSLYLFPSSSIMKISRTAKPNAEKVLDDIASRELCDYGVLDLLECGLFLLYLLTILPFMGVHTHTHQAQRY